MAVEFVRWHAERAIVHHARQRGHALEGLVQCLGLLGLVLAVEVEDLFDGEFGIVRATMDEFIQYWQHRPAT